jgi:molybdopterin/thiamine biosynthesis adenylyltransferase
MSTQSLRRVECFDLPEHPSVHVVYRLLPKDPDEAYYRERTDRNIGWITRAEQEMLRHCVVGIAGCGGMGGQLGGTFERAGIDEERIADSEVFDVSNIHRQFAAKRRSIGKSKVLETAREIRDITDDTTLVVYPQGITEATVDDFLRGCDLVCDEIELLALDARILLHQRARKLGISLMNCNSVGLSTTLFLYTPTSMTMEEAVGMDYDEAKKLCSRMRAGDREATERIFRAMIRGTVPILPEYSPDEPEANRAALLARIINERKAPIIASNPTMASGVLANRVLLYLLRNSGMKRNVAPTVEMPGYLHFDSGTWETIVKRGAWWIS